MRADDRAVDEMGGPVEQTSRIRLPLERRQHGIPDTSMHPAVELRGDRPPRAVALRQVAPLGAGPVHPEDAVEQTAAVTRLRPTLRFREQWLQPCPVLVGKFVSVSHLCSV